MKTQRLDDLTKSYWQVSRCYNGQDNIGITVETALKHTASIINGVGPHRRLKANTIRLRDAIVRGKPTQSKKTAQK